MAPSEEQTRNEIQQSEARNYAESLASTGCLRLRSPRWRSITVILQCAHSQGK